jgi:hypothetical protein
VCTRAEREKKVYVETRVILKKDKREIEEK